MKRYVSKGLLEYCIYLLILLGCIAGVYWRFWYKPAVKPIVMLDTSAIELSNDKMQAPLLDPAFNWNLIRTQLNPPVACFRTGKDQETIVIKPGEKLGNWELKSVTEDTAIMVRNGDERVVYLEP